MYRFRIPSERVFNIQDRVEIEIVPITRRDLKSLEPRRYSFCPSRGR